MTSPKLATTRQGQRVYTDPTTGTTDLVSVTSALGNIGGKLDAMVGWAIKLTADEAATVAQQTAWDDAGLAEFDVTLVKKRAHAKRYEAAERGTAIHDHLDRYLTTGIRPSFDTVDVDHLPYVESGIRFVNDWAPQILHTEITVFNLDDRWAGTIDVLGHMPGIGTCILDWKTGKRLYLDNMVQQNAYANAQHGVNSDGQKVTLPPIDAVGVIHLHDDGTYSLHVEAPSPDLYDLFLHSLAISEALLDGHQFPPALTPPDPKPLQANLIERIRQLPETLVRPVWPSGVPGGLSTGIHTMAQLRAIETAIEPVETQTEASFNPAPQAGKVVGMHAGALAPAEQVTLLQAEYDKARQGLPPDLYTEVLQSASLLGHKKGTPPTQRFVNRVAGLLKHAWEQADIRTSRLADMASHVPPATWNMAIATTGLTTTIRATDSQVNTIEALLAAYTDGVLVADIEQGTLAVTPDTLAALMVRVGTKATILKAGKTQAKQVNLPAPKSAAQVADSPVLSALVSNNESRKTDD